MYSKDRDRGGYYMVEKKLKSKVNSKTKEKRKRKKKIIKKEFENEFLIFAFLLSTVSILATALKSYTFPLFGCNISFSVFILPCILFTSNYITKKFGFNYSFKATIISTLIVIAFIILIEDLIGKKLDFIEIGSQSISYFVSIFVNSAIYYYIISNMEIKRNGILVYFCYIFSMFINHIIYMLFTMNMIVTDSFWQIYFTSVIIEAVISIALVAYDTKIKRGIE